MSKTVKHCEVCQENFGDRFSYCPVCGSGLKTVEVGASQAYAVPSNAVAENPPLVVPREETVAAVAATTPLSAESIPQYVSREPAAANGASNFKSNEPAVEVENFDTNPEHFHNDGFYHLTILQAPKNHRRDFGMGALFGGTTLLIALTAFWIWGLYQVPLDSEPVGDEPLFAAAYLSSDDPVEEEKPEPEKKDNNKGGGGGGGGKNDPKPVQEGVMPKMTREKQIIAPDVERVVNDKFELKQQATLEGPDIKQKPSLERYGVVNGGKDASGGWGEGRGLGNGRGSGIGNGDGTGMGNGKGSGLGNGNGNGIGNGTGDGLGEPPPPVAKKEPAPVVSEPLKILSQPRPGYTEEARKNNVQGVVRLRVTFSATGQVTNITTMSGLPYGLTEKAIDAARQISFVPKKENGKPVSVSRPVEFRFTMY